ncbi:hypothetical protein Wcon_00926 [Wolbachia endosymbiont of Cylisticus convexus]|uniref:hypothetical protein n=1 Tax=Wolbachia endosymbiont of Cylisticus convexus TaxID=118728 RepID=UPI000DF6D184|nr:hypothetical protein [Wolbachia endosymbiont of Cylisticus convexus]RDD34963.1 hypothetical protein Wcon_00926 [Wolbachia endosymbiont of Cylisticus convexus]
MNSFEIPLLRDIKYGHAIDDFSVENFLATPEGLRLRPALSPLFEVPFATGDSIVGFYYGNDDTIYLAKVSAVFLLTIYQIDLAKNKYKEIFTLANVSQDDRPSMCDCNDYKFWLISGKLYRLVNETFTEIDLSKGDIKPKDIVDFAVMNSTIYLLSKGEVFYTSDFAEFKKWEAFTIISYAGKGVGLGVIKNNLCIFTENGMEVWYGQPSSDGLFPLTKRRELSVPYKLISKRTLENNGTFLIGAFHSIDGKFVIICFDGQEMKVLDNAPLWKDRSIINYVVSSMFNYNNNTYYVLFFNLPNGKPNVSYCLHLSLGIWTLLREQNANYHVNVKSRVYCLLVTNNLKVCKTSGAGDITFNGVITTDYFPSFKPYITEQLAFLYFYGSESEMFIDMFISYKRDFALEPDYRVTIFADEFEESREKMIKLNYNLFGINSGLVHFKFEFKECNSSFLLKRIYGKERV